MLSLAIKGLKYNKKKYSIVALLSIIGFSFIYFILQLLGYMNSNKADDVDDGFISLLIIFIVVFVVCIYMSISVVLYILYKMRKSEIYTLSTIGASNKTIKRIFRLELIFLNLITIIGSSIVGAIIINIFTDKYESQYTFDLQMFLVFFILSTALFMTTGMIQINKIFKELNIVKKRRRKRSKKLKSVSIKKQRHGIIVDIIVGLIFIFATESIKEDSVKLVTFLIGIGVLIKPVLIVIIEAFKFIFDKLGLTFLSVSLKQVQFNLKKIKSLVMNFAVSMALIIVIFTMYNSLIESGMVYSKDNMKYTSLIQLDGIQTKENFQENENTFKALALKGDYKKEDDTLITGINKDYSNFETLDFALGSIDNLSSDGDEINCIIPELMRITNNLKLDDIISMDVLGEKVKFKVVGTIYTYNYKEIFADEKKLSAQLLGQSDLINTVYVKDDDKYIYEEIEDNKISYTSIERDTLIDEYKDGILNGTEMVETFLYVYLAVSVFLIINMLLMSLEEKRRYNYVFEKLGLRKSKIVVMNVMETIVIALIGMTLGLIFGTLLNSGLPKTVEIMYGVRMKIFLPLGLLISIGVFTELVILLAAFAISLFSTNSKNLRLSGGEE